jgi:hypothetical protein
LDHGAARWLAMEVVDDAASQYSLSQLQHAHTGHSTSTVPGQSPRGGRAAAALVVCLLDSPAAATPNIPRFGTQSCMAAAQ